MTSVAVMNAKGGVGKSTLTMAIAETLAEQHGKSSLIIDSDGQMSVSLMMARGQLLAERAEAKLTLVHYFVQKVLEGNPKSDKNPASWGFEAYDRKYGDLVRAGIIDPAKVVRTALQNASSVAGLLLTTEAMVWEVPEEKGAAAPPAPDMGGMGGMY